MAFCIVSAPRSSIVLCFSLFRFFFISVAPTYDPVFAAAYSLFSLGSLLRCGLRHPHVPHHIRRVQSDDEGNERAGCGFDRFTSYLGRSLATRGVDTGRRAAELVLLKTQPAIRLSNEDEQ